MSNDPVANRRASAREQVYAADLGQQIDEIVVASGVVGRDAPGCCVGVSWAGVRVVRAYGCRRLEPLLPVTAGTPFCLGSITKQFTAAAVLQLAESATLDLTKPLGTYLPQLYGPVAEVPLWTLLNHTSGISHKLDALMRAGSWCASTDEALALLSCEPPSAPPALTWSYSNTGYFLLALVVEHVSGIPFHEYVRRQVIAPARLTSTRFDHDPQVGSLGATGHVRSDPGFGSVNTGAQPFTRGSGDLWSVAGDLLTWWDALAAGRVVSPATLRQMTTPCGATAPHYGYGLFVTELGGHREISHDGNSGGFSTQLASYPDDRLTIAVLLNGSRHVAEQIEKLITRATLRLPVTVPLDLIMLPDQALPLVGVYDLGDRRAEVFLEAGRLMVRSPGGHISRLLNQGGSEFWIDEDVDLRLIFETDRGDTIRLAIYKRDKLAQSGYRVKQIRGSRNNIHFHE